MKTLIIGLIVVVAGMLAYIGNSEAYPPGYTHDCVGYGDDWDVACGSQGCHSCSACPFNEWNGGPWEVYCNGVLVECEGPMDNYGCHCLHMYIEECRPKRYSYHHTWSVQQGLGMGTDQCWVRDKTTLCYFEQPCKVPIQPWCGPDQYPCVQTGDSVPGTQVDSWDLAWPPDECQWRAVPP